MTPHQPSPEHPDIDTLADLAEDLLTPGRATEVRNHLAGCPECTETVDALAEVSRLLAEDGADTPAVPEDVAARIDAALAAEAAAQHAVPAVPGPTATAAPAGPPAPKAVPGRSAGAAAAPPGRADASRGPGRADRPRRRRGGRILLATAALAGALTLGSFLFQQSGGQSADTASSARAGNAPAIAGAAAPSGAPSQAGGAAKSAKALPEFREDQLPAQVRGLLAGHTGEQLGTGTQPNAMPDPDGPATATAVPSCVTAAAGHPGEVPRAAAAGRYRGTAVTLLVYPAAGADRLDVYLVTPDCPGAAVLLTSSVPAP